MAAVRAGRGRLPEGEAPDSHVAEEGKRVIKELVARQTTTATSLEQQCVRQQEREFLRAATVLPLGSASAGTSTLTEFEERATRGRRLEELTGAGLAPADMKLLMDHESGLDAELRLTGPERQARAERLQSIQTKLASTLNETPRSEAEQCRREQAPASTLQLAGVRMALRRPTDSHFRDVAPLDPEHPARRLPALERGVLARSARSSDVPPCATSRKRRRGRQAVDEPKMQAPPALLRGGLVDLSKSEVPCGAGGGPSRSLWDVRDCMPAVPAEQQRRPKATLVGRRPQHGPERQKQYTILDGRIVELSRTGSGPEPTKRQSASGQEFVPTGHDVLPKAAIADSRLTVEQIRQIPRFAAYEEGTPSRVLYVKNLDGTVTQDDLAAVFGAFRRPQGQPALSLKLCGGRMRGQAFVTFPSQEDASSALSVVNGYILKGRPMIVQYGRASQPAGPPA